MLGFRSDSRTISWRRAPRVARTSEKGYSASTALPAETAGVCPAINEHTQFVGAAIISQVLLFNFIRLTVAMQKRRAAESVDGTRGIQECPTRRTLLARLSEGIPADGSIAEVNRDAWNKRYLAG